MGVCVQKVESGKYNSGDQGISLQWLRSEVSNFVLLA